jgi:hypothetical protein
MVLACNPSRGSETALEAGHARGQRKRDKAAFRGLFDRGIIYDYTRNNVKATTTTKATLGKPRKLLLLMMMMIR